MSEIDEKYIKDCFHLAKQSLGKTSPNPLVGSVIVKNGDVISHGFHRKSGEAHAEIDAINNASTDITGATLYCNLEPCCHLNKKTPPCAQAIIKSGIKKVVISNLDPNPKVAGKGVKLLEEAGITVVQGILKTEGELLNEVFFTHIQKERPFIHLKWAQTLDGKIATLGNNSKWITNTESREYAHSERALYDSILVGAGTINFDDPSLTIRLPEREIECRRRIILGGSSELNTKARVFTDEFKDKTLAVSNNSVPLPSEIEVIRRDLTKDHYDLVDLLKTLYKKGIYSIYVEGGMQTIAHFINADIFDRVSVFVAPKLLGEGIGLSSKSVELMQDAIKFENGKWTQLGSDMLFESQRNVCLQD